MTPAANQKKGKKGTKGAAQVASTSAPNAPANPNIDAEKASKKKKKKAKKKKTATVSNVDELDSDSDDEVDITTLKVGDDSHVNANRAMINEYHNNHMGKLCLIYSSHTFFNRYYRCHYHYYRQRSLHLYNFITHFRLVSMSLSQSLIITLSHRQQLIRLQW
jgi:hypothetical protein